jgi:hypothetical protein
MPAIIVQMPQPWELAEAYLVCILLRGGSETGGDPRDARMEYFTLEKGVREDGSPRTMLCQWGPNDTHANWGEGPPPDAGAFAAAIEQVLDTAAKRDVREP